MLTFTNIFLGFANAAFENDLEADIIALSWKAVGVGSLALVVLILLSAWLKDKHPHFSKPLFIMIVISIVVPTFTLLGSTVYLNLNSYVGGPVHWHADFEVWACGNELELRDPQGALNNKIGTAVLHEHNDKRIHLEGVPITESDASLGKFMYVIEGDISDQRLILPINNNAWFEDEVDGDGKAALYKDLINTNTFITSGADGQFAEFNTNEMCGNQRSEVQVFKYSMVNDTDYKQEKVTNPEKLVISPEPNVPPGDCIIIEFGESRDFTDKLCEQFGVRDKDRCGQFGVEPDQKEICTLRDVTNYGLEPKAVTYDTFSNTGNDENDAACAPYFDDEGNPTGVELGTYKDDGTILDPEKDCDAYVKKLKSEAR